MSESPYKILIVHGVDGYPTKNWYGAVAKSLQAQGHEVVVPQFPTKLPSQAPGYANRAAIYDNYDHQTLAEWLPIAAKAIEGWDHKDVIIIGHSLGGALATKAAEKLANESPFRAVFEVAPVSGAINEVEIDPSFYQDIDWPRARAGAKQFTILGAPDDAVVPFSQMVRLASNLSANMVLMRNGGHLNADSGYTDLPRLLEEIERTINSRQTIDLAKPAHTAAGR